MHVLNLSNRPTLLLNIYYSFNLFLAFIKLIKIYEELKFNYNKV